MTPKEKALRLTENFIAPTMDRGLCNYYKSFNIAKQCALIAVDELIYETQFEVPNVRQKYWLSVKQEIEKL